MFFWLPIFASVITNVADLRHAVWSDLHVGDEFALTCTVTAEIRLSKHHWLDLKYLFQKTYGDDDEEGDRHVIGIGYTYKF